MGGACEQCGIRMRDGSAIGKEGGHHGEGVGQPRVAPVHTQGTKVTRSSRSKGGDN